MAETIDIVGGGVGGDAGGDIVMTRMRTMAWAVRV